MRVGEGKRVVSGRAEKRSFSRTTPLDGEDGPTPLLTKPQRPWYAALASYSQGMWVLPDVRGLFSNNVGSFFDNVGRKPP
jgi:hypothetical protein